jgi:hypothetical protein
VLTAVACSANLGKTELNVFVQMPRSQDFINNPEKLQTT